MNDKKIQTLTDVHSFLDGAIEIEFVIEDKDENNLEWVRGYLRQTVIRLVVKHRKSMKVQQRQRNLRLIVCNSPETPTPQFQTLLLFS